MTMKLFQKNEGKSNDTYSALKEEIGPCENVESNNRLFANNDDNNYNTIEELYDTIDEDRVSIKHKTLSLDLYRLFIILFIVLLLFLLLLLCLLYLLILIIIILLLL